jgi:hypothetical protein
VFTPENWAGVFQSVLAATREISLALETHQPWKNCVPEVLQQAADQCLWIARQLQPVCPQLAFPCTAVPFPPLPKEAKK